MTARLSKPIVLGLVLLAAWLRLWHLNSTPPGLWFDEGFNGMEAFWMLKTQTWPVFILGGQGREVLFFYLLALFMAILGDAIYVLRLAATLLGVLSIPLMYRWALTLFKGEPNVAWLALISTAGLAVSFWLLVMNRVSYRANTLLPLLLLTGYFFWCGWQSGKLRYYWAAGVGLGLCQYTYLAGRLVPLVFALFVLAQTLWNWKSERAKLKVAWMGLLVMGSIAALMFTPMLLTFARYPELFWERSEDVALEINGTDGPACFGGVQHTGFLAGPGDDYQAASPAHPSVFTLDPARYVAAGASGRTGPSHLTPGGNFTGLLRADGSGLVEHG
ncbi:MAG: glycosyltransferase family 39 protein [Chloroflexi bacterium]|nr:glycosyltransferase family 39 protein [Chloroflexota bacterium]